MSDRAHGLKKTHTVKNPATGEERVITQDEWKNRRSDPSLAGFERDDADEQVPEAPDVVVPDEGRPES